MRHKFVDFIPEKLEQDVLYVSMEFGTVAHACCCGCGQEVFTPLSPTDWKLTYNGATISLSPSIGNWNFDCQSRYWIVNNKVKWSGKWTEDEILAGKERDQDVKQKFYSKQDTVHALSRDAIPGEAKKEKEEATPGLWTQLKKLFS